MKTARRIQNNLKLWEELTKNHLKDGKVYHIDKFKKGKTSLHEIELREVGSVRRKKLLHLQCHFGMDTLSWARLGARVTGVDFSPSAIKAAVKLAVELHVPARFLTCDVLKLPSRLKGRFDIVYASYGALYWIPDLFRWFKVAAHFLKKKGFLYVVDGHPFHNWVSMNEPRTDIAKFRLSYFDRSAQQYLNSTDYADRSYHAKAAEFGWHFTIGDLVSAALKAGFAVEFLHEFPCPREAGLKESWPRIGKCNHSPVLFSLKAVKNV